MKDLNVYFDEKFIKNTKDKNHNILFNCSPNFSLDKYKSINFLIDDYANEIREKVWFWYKKYTTEKLNESLTSKFRWINEKLKFAIISSRFNSGNIIDSDITNIIKIISIIVWSKHKKIKKIKFYGFNKKFIRPIKNILKFYKINIKLIFEEIPKNNLLKKIDLNILKGHASIFKFLFKFIFKKKRGELPRSTKKSNYIFIDYLFNLDDRLNSSYWGEITNLLPKGSTVEILHIFVNSKETPSISKANKLIDKLNNKKNKHKILHRLVNSEMNLLDLVHSIFEFFIIIFYSLKSKNDSLIYDLIKKDLSKSFYTSELLNSLIYKNFFFRYLNYDLSKTNIIFVGENQSWEKSLSYVAIKRNCKKSVFSIQTSIRFWDMRFYKPFINITDKNRFPSIIACNSKFSYLQLSKIIPNKYLKIVENNRSNINYKKRSKFKKKRKYKFIWLIGEYSKSKTEQIFDLIIKSDYTKKNYKLVFRPHPSDTGDFYNKNKNIFHTIDDKEEYENGDLMIGDSTSSYLVESYLMGRKVLVFERQCEINLSAFYMTKMSPNSFSNFVELNFYLNSYKKIEKANKKLAYNFYEKNVNYTKWVSVLNENNF